MMKILYYFFEILVKFYVKKKIAKTGVILYGKPGTGKTFFVECLLKKIYGFKKRGWGTWNYKSEKFRWENAIFAPAVFIDDITMQLSLNKIDDLKQHTAGIVRNIERKGKTEVWTDFFEKKLLDYY